jgi:hypothetical protein
MNMATEKKTPAISPLDAALLVAQTALNSVGKDAKNQFHKYSYTSAEGMIGACRDALHGAGLVARRTTWKIDPAIGEFGILISTMVVAHPESGATLSDEIVWAIVPEKGRPYDKALAGALTSSLNYWLRDLLMVPREDETMDSRDDREYAPRSPSRPAPTPAPARPAAAPAPRPALTTTPTNGEWVEIYCKYVNEGVAGKNQTPYVNCKNHEGQVWFVWDTALQSILKQCQGKTVWAITEESKVAGKPPRILELRTTPPEEAHNGVDID